MGKPSAWASIPGFPKRILDTTPEGVLSGTPPFPTVPAAPKFPIMRLLPMASPISCFVFEVVVDVAGPGSWPPPLYLRWRRLPEPQVGTRQLHRGCESGPRSLLPPIWSFGIGQSHEVS